MTPEPLPDTCQPPPGRVGPVVDPARCEGKADCVAVCPVDVFAVGRIDGEVFRDLPVLAKLKVWVHGMQTATTPNVEQCLGCALCVTACPERAIRLRAVGRGDGAAG